MCITLNINKSTAQQDLHVLLCLAHCSNSIYSLHNPSSICWLYRGLRQKIAHVFILRCNLEVEPYQVLLVREHELWSHSTVAVRQREYDIWIEQLWANSLMMFFRSLVSSQSFAIVVVAQESILEAFAALYRVGDRRSSDKKTVVFHAWQVLELLETAREQVPMRLCDFGSEFEEYCNVLAHNASCT